MTTERGFEQHLGRIESAAADLVRGFETAGPDARVPTCPEWRARDLVVHQGIIHRWAAAQLRREPDAGDALEEADVLASVADDRLPSWSEAGARDLLDTLATVAPDVEAMVFLNDAPPPRRFWARRQAHETTIHAVDALAASLGRIPTAEETGIGSDTALDGVDEILRGFFTRGPSKLYDGQPVSILVTPSDSARRWTFRAGADGAVTTYENDPAPDVTFTGTAAQLYLGLWNRGEEISATGDPAVLRRWRAVQHVTWG